MKEAPDAQAQDSVEVDPEASMGAGIVDETAEETADLFGEGPEETAQTQGEDDYANKTKLLENDEDARGRL